MGWFANPDPKAPHLFWLNGLAGTGKSTLAKTIALQAGAALIGSFFFTQDSNELSHSDLVFSTLSYQLFHSKYSETNPLIRAAIIRAVTFDQDLFTQDLATQAEELLVKSLSSSPQDPPVLLVVDAADECNRKDLEELLPLIISFIKRVPCAKVLITSRPAPHIRNIIATEQDLGQAVIHSIEEIDMDVVSNDIGAFVQHEMREIGKVFTVPSDELDGWPGVEDVQSVVEMSGRLFIFAVTATRFVGDTFVADPVGQLEILRGGEAVSGSGPYSHLNMLYQRVLDAALPVEHHGGPLHTRLQSVLGALCVLQDPLPLSSLARIIGLKEREVTGVLQHLHSVILVPLSNTDPLRIFHQSFANFLTTPGPCSSAFHIQEREYHTRLLIQCLTLMAEQDQLEINQAIQGEWINGGSLSPELEYACTRWVGHLVYCDPSNDAVASRLVRFMGSNFAWWIQKMASLPGEYLDAIKSMQRADRWAVRSSCTSFC